jgi:hypothetical protein
MSVSNSWGQNKSRQSSSNISVDSGTAQNIDQQAYMQNMWNTGNTLSQGGTGLQYGQMGYDQGIGYLNQAMQQMGSPYMSQTQDTLARMQNPGMDPMMDVYSRQIGRQFNEQVMPAMRGDASVAGQLGSSRAGIGQGLAAARAGQQIQDFGAQLYGQNQDRALQAANMQGALQGNIASMYGQGAQAAQQLGQFGMGIPWYALQQQQGLLGNAIMRDLGGMTVGDSSGKSSAWNQSGSFGM